jgi:polyhydroxybutyrate depolymerase
MKAGVGAILLLGGLWLTPVVRAGYLKSEFHELDGDPEYVLAGRVYVIHRPAGVNESTPLPAVLIFHGRGGFPGTVARQSQFNALADRFHFLAVYPEGTGQPDNGSFNAGTCCGEAAQKKLDDVGYVRALLDDLPNHAEVDLQRIYSTGMSNGASMSFRLAAELADRFAAVAPVSGNMGVSGPLPARPVPIICFYGMKDPYMSFAMINQSLQWWIKANHCLPTPKKIIRKKDYVLERYAPAGKDGAPIDFYKVTEGGHTWPGGIDINRGPGAGLTIATIPASELIWAFFTQFTRQP